MHSLISKRSVKYAPNMEGGCFRIWPGCLHARLVRGSMSGTFDLCPVFIGHFQFGTQCVPNELVSSLSDRCAKAAGECILYGLQYCPDLGDLNTVVGVAGKLEGTREEPDYDVQPVHRSFRCLLRKYILYIVIPARMNLSPISLLLTHPT